MGESVLSPEAEAEQAAAGAGRHAALFADAGLERRGGALHLGGVPLAEIAERVGTPAYVYNAGAIRERYRALAAALAPVPHRICFAVKANGNLAVLRLLRDLGAGADIVSGGELARALAAGFEPSRIVFSGVGKTAAELRAAVRAGVGHISVESGEELDRLGGIARELGRAAPVVIRVNPDVTTDTHPYIATGKGGLKFGVPLDQVRGTAARALAHPHLELAGLAMHLGSQLHDPAPFAEGVGRLLALLGDLRATGAAGLRVLDIGGGFGIRYGAEPPLDLRALTAAVLPALARAEVTVYAEPGRFLVGSAGVLLTAVVYRKRAGGKTFVVVDAGMNDLLRPSLYQAHHEVVPLTDRPGPAAPVDVVGPVCETGDFLALDRPLTPVEEGDRLAVLGAGAYGFVMASNYNSRPRPPEVLVDEGRWWVARRRETPDDLLRGEQLEA